jgi:hypothetical protein
VKFSRNPFAHVPEAQIEAILAECVAKIESDAPTYSPLTLDDIFQTLRMLGQPQPQDWRALAAIQKKGQVAAIRHEIAARAEELRRTGVPNPVTRAEKEIAERWQHRSGAALNRWLRRNTDPDKTVRRKMHTRTRMSGQKR